MKVTLKHSSARCMTAEKRDGVKTAGGVMAPKSCGDGQGVGTCPLGPPEGGCVKWLGCGQTLEGQLS